MKELGRVLDPDELRRHDGPAARWCVDVLEAWFTEGEAIEVVVPPRVVCARCDGGGCDGCGRSGAFRLSLDESTRTLQLTLPRAPEKKTVTVRLVQPFGAEAPIAQLWLELRASERASTSCRKLPRARPLALTTNAVTIGLIVAVLILLAVVLARR